jgi:hypothetical protein
VGRPKGSKNRQHQSLVQSAPEPTKDDVQAAYEAAEAKLLSDKAAEQQYDSEGREWPQESSEDKFAGAFDAALPFRKLWELAHKYGAPVRNRFNREELEASLRAVGWTPEGPQQEDVADYWVFPSRYVGKGPATAVDPNGDYTATVFQDGRCEILWHCPPNLLNRIPGHSYHDELLKFPNLEEFATRLVLLQNEVDKIFDESVAKDIADRLKEIERIKAQEGLQGDSVHGSDWKIAQMRELCPLYGFVGPSEPSVNLLPVKLAQALGVKLRGADGEEKDWQTLSADVLERAMELERVTETTGTRRNPC